MSKGIDTINKITLFQSLMERRVPQISGFYLGASWGLIQFIEWIVGRYGLSPYLPDFSLVILFSLLPSVIMVAYFHGRPGDDNWNRIEKISIPANLLFTASLLLMFFSGKDLGAATETIIIKNEEGETIERVIAKSKFRKKIALYNFKNNTENETMNWLEGGIPMLLHLDMMQDPFLDEVSMLLNREGTIYKKLTKAGFEKGIDVPIGLLSKITIEMHYQYFLTGSFKKSEDKFELTLFLYDARLGKKLATNTLSSKNILELVDQTSILTRENLEMPSSHLESIQDLPVAELSSANLEALFQLVHTLQELLFRNDFLKGIEHAEKAISLDSSFAMSHFYLGTLYAKTSQSEKSFASIRQALKYDYKLPEYFKFIVKDMYFLMSGESNKRLNLLKMQASLNPDNIDTRLRLIRFLSGSLQYEDAIAEFLLIMEIAPDPSIYLDNIGNLYIQMNEFDKAEEYYLQYANKFPSETQSFNGLAYLYSLQGKDDLVKANYEKSLFLDPDNLHAKLSLASLDEKAGDFEKAFKQYQSALSTSQEGDERVQVYRQLTNHHYVLGQPKKALEAIKSASKENKKFYPPLSVIVTDLTTVWGYIQAGDQAAAFEMIEQAEKQLQPPFDKLPALGYTLVYLELEKTEKALEHIKIFEGALQSLGASLQGWAYYPVKLRAQVAELKQNYQEALIGYQEYADNSPLDSRRFESLGRIYRKLNQFEPALKFLKKQLAISPYYPQINHELGLLYLAMNDEENSLKHFKIAAQTWKNAEQGYEKAEENTLQLNKLLAED